MNQVTIECKHIVKSFGDGASRITVLVDINLVVHAGEMILLMGPSGSGKSSLISIIGGILEQDSGECLILGKQMNAMSLAERTAFRGATFGFMFQYFNLVPTLTAVENAAIPLLLAGYDRREAFAKADALLLRLGLDQQRYRVPDELSGGEQQRVSLARACIHRPNIILCDEPTSFLDHDRGAQIMELLLEIKKETNCTLIVVTHDPRILKFGDRVVEIEDGHIKI